MPPQEQQRRARLKERAGERPASAAQPATANQTASQESASAHEQRQSELAQEEANVTAGKDGALNIRVQWVQVQLPHARPCRFAVTTAAGNALEVSMEQKSWQKSYKGTSVVQTDITPVAPIGTKGKLTVHDLTTGETVEQPWTWRADARGWPGLWALLKRLFT